MKNLAIETVKMVVQVGLIVFAMKSFAFAQNFIPSESMVPTLEVGDRLITDKTAYGWSRYSMMVDPGISMPGENGRMFGALPERGDVVTFTHPVSGDVWIKRVIGLPGDKIALRQGRVFINGKMLPRTFVKHYTYREFQGRPVSVVLFEEELPNGRTHAIIERSDSGYADFMEERTVPEGKLFLMGDNRDNSGDSRFDALGFVPVENLQGRARMISYSLHDCVPEDGLTCAPRRFFSAIR